MGGIRYLKPRMPHFSKGAAKQMSYKRSFGGGKKVTMGSIRGLRSVRWARVGVGGIKRIARDF